MTLVQTKNLVLGPILYAIFIKPLYHIEKITTFADNNYVISSNKIKEVALEELGWKQKYENNKMVKRLWTEG